MSKINIEVEQGAKPAEEPSAAEVAKTHPLPEKLSCDEVGGRELLRRRMQCWNCEGVSWIWYSTSRYKYYDCCYCGAVNGPF